MSHYYYTIYRKDYLYKGLVLYESMERYDKDFKFFVVCMEDESYELLKKLNYKDLVPINIKVIEEYDKRIPELKHQRGEKTYIWTAKASVPLYLFEHYPEMDHVIWVDGDTEFLSSPEPIYEQWGNYSVLITEERFHGQYEYLGHLVGFYNTGFMGFKKDSIGIKVLHYFRERLQEWKKTEEEQVNWNDQLYVDDWLERFPNVGVVKHNGINLTPFITSRINAEEGGFVNIREGVPYIGNTPIVLYHFMALKYYDNEEYDLCYYWMKFDMQTIKRLYIPYIKRCSEIFAKIKAVDADFYPALTKRYKYIGNYFNLRMTSEKIDYNVCTVTDSEGLVQTLALYDSIKKYDIKFKMWICCADEEAFNILQSLNLPEIMLFEPFNLIEYYHRLIKTGYKASKEILKARIINLIMLNNFSIESILYVDNDCYFHQSPKKVFDIIKKGSITLLQGKALGNGASFSNSVLGFTRDINAMDCMFYWVEETKKWLTDGNSVQDELDHMHIWDKRYSRINILRRPNNLLNDKALAYANIKKFNDRILVNDEELLLYKHSLPDNTENTINNFMDKLLKSPTVSKRYIYLPYIKSIKSSFAMLRRANR